MESLIPTIVTIILTYILFGFDRSNSRCGAISINGRTLPGFRAIQPYSWINRRVGLLNHGEIPRSFALWLSKTKSVHTMGMLAPIDVVFLSGSRVVDIYHKASPGQSRITTLKKADAVIEMQSGLAFDLNIDIGTHIQFVQPELGPLGRSS